MKDSIPKKQLRQFGIIIGLGIPSIIGWIIPLFGGHHFRTWTLWIGLPLLILGLLKPNLLYYPYKAWMALGNILGWINSRIILALVFILVLIPIAFIMKILRYDPLKQNYKNNILISYREVKRNKIDLTRIF